MGPDALSTLTSAVAPVVMVSAAGLLFTGVQAKNLHLADRIRDLTSERRLATTAASRRQQISDQLPLFRRRVTLSQRSLNMLFVAIFCFVATSLLLASSLWVGLRVLPLITTTVFASGLVVLVGALVFQFTEMVLALRTIEIEMGDVDGPSEELHDARPRARQAS